MTANAPRPLRSDPDRLAKHFHLIENSGARLIPVMMEDEDTGHVAYRLMRKGSGNTKGRGMRQVVSEKEAYDLVKFGQYAIRTVCERSGREAQRIVGDKVLRAVWTGPTTGAAPTEAS